MSGSVPRGTGLSEATFEGNGFRGDLNSGLCILLGLFCSVWL